MNTYRAAIIGCGKIGSEYADHPLFPGIQSHAEAYVICPETELVAICDIDPKRKRKCGERWDVPAFQSIEEMFEKTAPQIVSICTPDETHAPIVQQVLAHQSLKALVVEKPLATRVEEAEKIVEAAESRGVPVAVNYSRRFAKSHARLLDMIKKGDLGRILHVSGLYSKGLLHTGTHWLDLAMYFFGDIRKSMGHYSGQQNGDDPELDFYLEFDSGATGFVKGCPAEAYSVFEMDVIGTGGRLRILDSGCRFELFQKEMDPRSNAGWILAKVCDEEIGFEDFLYRHKHRIF